MKLTFQVTGKTKADLNAAAVAVISQLLDREVSQASYAIQVEPQLIAMGSEIPVLWQGTVEAEV